MILRQNFKLDFDAVLNAIQQREEPFAFTRYGEGEAKIAKGMNTRLVDFWSYQDGSEGKLSQANRECLVTDMPGWNAGISCPCCDKHGFKWFIDNVKIPEHRLTFANLFVNSNYMKFEDTLLKHDWFFVGPAGCDVDYEIPANAVTPLWDWRPLIDELQTCDKPIALATGPLAGPIALDYWKSSPNNKQSIVDVGSTFDPLLKGRCTRRYQKKKCKRQRSKVCQWDFTKHIVTNPGAFKKPNYETYTGREKSAADVMEMLYEQGRKPKTFLNVGMNTMFSKKRGVNELNSWWQQICEANGMEYSVLEIWPQNVDKLQKAGVPNVLLGDAREADKLQQNYDIVMWWHGPEHVIKEEAMEAFKKLEEKTNMLFLIGCPIGKEPQGAAYGNPNEEHKAVWRVNEIKNLMFNAQALIEDHDGKSHVTAWKWCY